MGDEQERHPIHITTNGNVWFGIAVLHLLDILQEHLPQRYQEAITYMPHIEYAPDLKSTGNPGRKALGRSDGKFAMQGYVKTLKNPSFDSDYDSDTEVKRIGKEFNRFLWVYLHEVGHNVMGKQQKDWSEKAANKYADTVMRELREKGAIN